MSSYFNINIRVTIAGKIQFGSVKQIEIANSIELLTTTAKVELPREFKNTRKDGQSFSIERKNLLELIKVGDSIHIPDDCKLLFPFDYPSQELPK